MEGPILFCVAFALVNTISAKVVLNDLSEAPDVCALPGSDGILVAHEECNKFYECDDGVPVAQACPGNLQWNHEQGICDWPDNVKCAAASPSRGNADPSEASEICAAAGSDGVLVAHEECNKFYKCSEGVPVALNCPENLQWNSAKDICDWPQNVNCQSSVKAAAFRDFVLQLYANPSEAAAICSAPGFDGTLVPHEDCHKFYLCAGGLTVAFSCPEDLLFDPKSEQCEWPANVDCGNRNS